jgi:hypothetical protein
MGGVREEAPLEVREIATEEDAYPGLGQMQDIVDELRGVPGAYCRSTLESAMRTLRITDAAEQQIQRA